MTFTVIQAFKIKGTVQEIGTILELSGEQSDRLKGYVAAVPHTTTFEQSGDPVSCPYWYQVCWAVDMYKEQCTRNADCRVFKFLEINAPYSERIKA